MNHFETIATNIINLLEGNYDIVIPSSFVSFMVDGDELNEVLTYKVKKASGTNLSITGCLVMWYAKELGEAKFLTGDRRLRCFAEKDGLKVSGIFSI